METMEPTALYNALIIWLGFVAALFVAAQSPMEKFIKPFVLHPLRARYSVPENAYTIICQIVVLLVTGIVAWPLREQLDLFGNVFGYFDYHPFMGTLPAIFVAAFAGQHIHDQFGTTEEPADES